MKSLKDICGKVIMENKIPWRHEVIPNELKEYLDMLESIYYIPLVKWFEMEPNVKLPYYPIIDWGRR